MDLQNELERLADGFAELSFPPLSALVFIEHPERPSLDDVGPADWPRIKRVSLPNPRTIIGGGDAVRAGLRALMERGGLLLGMSDVPGLPPRDRYPKKPCAEYWMHCALARVPDSVTYSRTHAESGTATTRMQIDNVAFVCQEFAGKVREFLFDATWPVLGTKESAAAIGKTPKTVDAWSEKHPDRIRRLGRGQFKVNPEWMTDEGRKKHSPPSGVNRE